MEIIRTASFKVWEAPERSYLFARWSYQPAERALIFVHGLASSWDTWVPFRTAIERPEMAGTDVFWFDYPSLGTTIQRATLRFREALNGLIDGDSSAFQHPTFPPTRSKPTYTAIDIVAHSLGAVVARGGLADRSNHIAGQVDVPAPPSWKVQQLLLAPALLGSKLPWLMKYVGTESFFSALQLIRRGGFSAIMDLKEGSNHLNKLESQVNARLTKTPVAASACGLHVQLTTHGTEDFVVVQGNYAQDDNYELITGDHFTVVRTPSHLALDFVLGQVP